MKRASRCAYTHWPRAMTNPNERNNAMTQETVAYPPTHGKTTTPMMSIMKHGRYWAVHDAEGALVCIAVYKKGALEVARRLQGRT